MSRFAAIPVRNCNNCTIYPFEVDPHKFYICCINVWSKRTLNQIDTDIDIDLKYFCKWKSLYSILYWSRAQFFLRKKSFMYFSSFCIWAAPNWIVLLYRGLLIFSLTARTIFDCWMFVMNLGKKILMIYYTVGLVVKVSVE